jgi:hypothetical protein
MNTSVEIGTTLRGEGFVVTVVEEEVVAGSWRESAAFVLE